MLTAVTCGPDGALYVSQLTGFRIHWTARGSGACRPAAASPRSRLGGLTNVVDLTFDAEGNLYVLELAADSLLSDDLTGALLRFAPGATEPELLARDGLVAPGSVAVAPDGAVYVSNLSNFPGQGQVLRLESP